MKNQINAIDAQKLAESPLAYALLMTDSEIYDVVAIFLEVLERRRKIGGDQNR